MMGGATTPQPMPEGDGPLVLPFVIQDLKDRSDLGLSRYGTRLRAHNGRNALWDAYQEALDLVMYLRQAILEMDGHE